MIRVRVWRRHVVEDQYDAHADEKAVQRRLAAVKHYPVVDLKREEREPRAREG